MSEAMAFDTHKNFKRLTEAGADEKLAEAIIDCQSVSQSELATKSDLRAEVARLETAMAKMESRLIKWVVGMAIGIVFSQTALTVALIKLLP